MRNWLIYEPPGGAAQTLDDAEKFVTVREGFSKAAFFLAPFWLAAKRCWLALLVWAVAMVAVLVAWGVAGVGGGAGVILLLLPNFAVGLENAWIRARALERRGFTLAGAAMARTRDEAELAFFQDWAERREEEPRHVPAAPYERRPQTRSGVLGLFPEPGR